MKKQALLHLIAILLVTSILLGACQAASSTPNPTSPQNPPVTSPPTQPALPTPPLASARRGAWVDQLIFTAQAEPSSAIMQILAGDIDLYASPVSDAAVFKQMQSDPNITNVQSVGSNNEITFNPSGPEFTDGRLNPFNNHKIREAMNWLVDRDYIAKEMFGGLAIPKYVPTSAYFPDYARYIDIIRQLEVKYAYDKEKARQVITDEMHKLGASLGSDGKWQYNDQPVVLIGVFRMEDTRQQIGDYVADQLESIGFTVERLYKDRSGASPLIWESNADEGKWHFYTGGWIVTAISRDDSTNFGFFYTPLSGDIYQTTEQEFMDVAEKLWVNDFTSMDERRNLWAKALPLALEDSARVWLIDLLGATPMRTDMSVASDLAGGVSGASLYPYTMRLNDHEGGVIRIALPDVLAEPWNTIAGSGFIHDTMPWSATIDGGAVFDPYTGLNWPLRIEKAEVVAKEGLPIAKTLDWLTLTTAPKIEVPGDAWVDWDTESQTFITAGEKYTQTIEANTKVTIYYPKDMFTTVTWHDGSPISVGDFLIFTIMYLDLGKAGSPIYDEAFVPNTEAYLSHFKGLRIKSSDPLVLEVYDDMILLDAETLVWLSTYYPTAPWQTLGLGYLANASQDKASQLAFSNPQATLKEVEWLSYVSGPSLDILNGWMTKAAQENYIPFAPTLGQFISADEASLRWSNLQKWYAQQGHFWLGTGPFYLDEVYPVEKMLTLTRYDNYPDLATRWMGFGEPKLPAVSVDGPSQVTSGETAQFDVSVSFDNSPYPAAEIDLVKYLVFDADKQVIASGDEVFVEDGHYSITLPGVETSKFIDGTNILEVVVTSKMVSIPVIEDLEFISISR